MRLGTCRWSHEMCGQGQDVPGPLAERFTMKKIARTAGAGHFSVKKVPEGHFFHRILVYFGEKKCPKGPFFKNMVIWVCFFRKIQGGFWRQGGSLFFQLM